MSRRVAMIAVVLAIMVVGASRCEGGAPPAAPGGGGAIPRPTGVGGGGISIRDLGQSMTLGFERRRQNPGN